ncbi:hypothetical protein IQ254_16785 [Nodosilinea sp. LEGE 07088]|uniref:hypothetical protein n=1 Tax=Nodosilinea sp. LEGE 07088 TaxID=2777968 RepID=UPI0018814724|nr:hypothetical protein [Nodosilinea sp. LEGE 07088]MBE9138830.1 hypothetical protein [Nodosilinea sp. LEGE 07088]
MSAFVGVKTVETVEQLEKLIKEITGNNRVFFLRWPHKVSGLSRDWPEGFPSPEGQVFTRDRELRWKAQGQGYSVLLLSETEKVDGFDKVGAEWETCDRPAHTYPPTETRFPQGLADRGINIEQRYFRDKKTATVHFVALVAK